MVEAQLVNRGLIGQTGDMLQQLGTAIDPAIAGLLPGNFITQLQQLSMNPAPAMVSGTEIAGNQIPPTNQHPIYNPVIGEPDLVGQGQGQGQEGGDNQMEEDLMSMEMPAYQMTSSPKGTVW